VTSKLFKYGKAQVQAEIFLKGFGADNEALSD